MKLADVDLRLLRVFRAVVECEGLAAAEAKLDIGRSTISTHLSDLEARLGMVLCKRGRAGFELTEAGRATFAATIDLFNHCETFLSSVQQAGQTLRGRLTLAVFDGCLGDSQCRIHDAIRAIRQQSDAVQFEVIVLPPDEVEVAVLNGRAVIGVSTRRTPSDALSFTRLYDETSHLYCAVSLGLATGHVTQGQIAEAGYVTRSYARQTGSQEDVGRPGASAVAHSEEAVAHLILSGAFVGHLPEHFARPFVEANQMRRVRNGDPSYTTSVGLLRAIRERDNPMAAAMADALIAQHTRADH